MSQLLSGDFTGRLSDVKPYLLNIKSAFGVIAILFTIHLALTSVTEKWATYVTSAAANMGLIEQKNNLTQEEAKLKAISRELDKLTTKAIEVNTANGESPELAALKLTQKVVALCESSNNLFDKLEPKGDVTLSVDSAVTLPINVPGAPTAAPSTPTPGGAKIDPKNAITGFKYQLIAKGTYIDLVTFIHQMTLLEEFVILNSVQMKPTTMSTNIGKQVINPNELLMTLEFTVPWQQTSTRKL